MVEQLWQVYMILTERGTYYTGVTTDIRRRWNEHVKGGVGAKYLRANKPKALIYLELEHTQSSSLRREAALKKLTKQKKENCVNSDINQLRLYVESGQSKFSLQLPVIVNDMVVDKKLGGTIK